MFTRRALLEGIALTALVLFMYALALGADSAIVAEGRQ